MVNSYKSIILKSEARKRRSRQHPWIFSNEIQLAPDVSPGDLVLLRFSSGSECWTGYYNPHSLIAARVLDEGSVKIDDVWFSQKLSSALEYRRRLRLPREALRLVNGEADGLPGLVIDQYGAILVVQSQTAGMDQLLPMVSNVLPQLTETQGVLARSDSNVRILEGLELSIRLLYGEIPEEVTVNCHAITLHVDVRGGQKTGLFLDQMENNQFLSQFAPRQNCLDVCCYSGACSLLMKQGGATEVLGIDISKDAINLARRNAEINQSGQTRFEVRDAFDLLQGLSGEGLRYGVLNLDPPPFAKRKKDVGNALRGYRELNRRAFKLVSEGGVLSTSTCSHHITRERFLEMLILAARDSGRQAKVIEMRGQADDHPALLSAPETSYLTCAVMLVE